MKKLHYRLHWASGSGPRPSLKWVVYDWSKEFCCPVAYAETRVMGRKLCAWLNANSAPETAAGDSGAKE